MKFSLIVFVFFLCSFFQARAQNEPLQLWYDSPASQWEEYVPLGNGRIGMMPSGGVFQEKITLNEISLWSGAPQDANNYEAHERLDEVRDLIIRGRNDLAQDIVNEHFTCLGPGSESEPFGKFQTLGSLIINYKYPDSPNDINKSDDFSGYRRSLNIQKAVATTSFSRGGVRYSREYFTSFNEDVGVIRLESNKPGKLNLEVSLDRPERFKTEMEDGLLKMHGTLESGTDQKGMQYVSFVDAKLDEGTVERRNGKLIIKNATIVELYISMETDFWNEDFNQIAKSKLNQAKSIFYKNHKSTHVSAFQELFNRLHFGLEGEERNNLPTGERLLSFKKDPASDNSLPVLFFQFGRYLGISSTRPGSLPPNLQGLWAHQIDTPWNGDYHLDVNVQMNHWPFEVANLSELNLPLTSLVEGLVDSGKRTAKAYYDAEGWVAHVVTNIWGFTEPGESASWGVSNAGSGWVCNNLWQHYEYTLDKEYLARIYPILKGSSDFYNSVMVEDPTTGWLVTAPSVSPENWFVLPNGEHASVSMGPTIDNQIVRELFQNVIEASKVLKVDNQYREKLVKKLEKLPPVGRVGEDGSLMEWLRDYEDVDPQHRHISHLYGIYPSDLITPKKTPDLIEPSKKVLEVRGDDGPSWAIAYKMILWARMYEGERAFELFRNLIRPTLATNINYGSGGGVYPNLFSAGPPFQIDGNFGGMTGIAEMILQSHEPYIELLPALPEIWKKGGEIRGWKARGNITVNAKWKDGEITDIELISPKINPEAVSVKMNGKLKKVQPSTMKNRTK